MNRFVWLMVAGISALLMNIPANAIDTWIVGQGWFPKNTHYGGMSGIVFAGIIAASLPSTRLRKYIAALCGAGGALFIIWATRYLMGLNLSASFTIEQLQAYTQIHWVLMFTIGLGAGTLATMSMTQGRFWVTQAVLVLLAGVGTDLAVKQLGIDVGTMNRVLYYQTVEIEVHQPVSDPELLYGLKPGAQLGGEGPWGLRTVTVNQLGARSPEYSTKKPVNLSRTLVFGGSTLYGAGVSNHQTTPGVMDQMLGPNHEVWNFGVCAYNTAQSAYLAASLIDMLDPDRIIIMITNTGRRAFMGGPVYQNADKSIYFEQNPFLYLENFPPTLMSEQAHQNLLEISALYRTYTAWHRAHIDPDTTYSDRADKKAVAALEAEAAKRDVEVLYVLSPSRGSEIGPSDMGVPPIRWLDLHIPGRAGDYQQAHPPPAVLAEYGVRIVEWMNARG